MTTVRSVVHPGWIEVTGRGVHAVVAAAERHAEPLTAAAQDGLPGLLEALTAHGLGGAPDLAAVSVSEAGVRVLVRGAGSVVLADGTRIASQGRLPWRDLDVDLADAGDEVAVAAPEPQTPRGWRRPARLARPAVVPADVTEAVVESGRTQRDLLVDSGTAEDEPAVESGRTQRDLLVDSGTGEDEPAVESGRTRRDLLVDSGTGEVGAEPEVEGSVPEPDLAAPEPTPSEPDLVAPEPTPSEPDLTLPPPDEASAGLAPAARVPVTAPPKGGLIDSVPWRRGGAAAAGTAAASGPTPRTAELPVHTPPPPPPPPVVETAVAAPTDPAGDGPPQHDGSAHPGDDEPAHPGHDLPGTAPSDADRPAPLDEHPAVDVTTDRGSLHRSDDDLDRPVVLAVLCPAGHPSPPHAGACRSCGREIPPQQPFQTPRPALGVLRISTGGVVPLDRGVLLGRAPRVNEELPANQRPHLLKVGGVDRDISRNHAEVVLEGWHVLVRDLGSTNGTTVTLPGEEAVRLRPTEDHGIEPGTVITLADEVSLTYEVDG